MKLSWSVNLQGRFRHLEGGQVDAMRRNIDWEWKRLRAKVAMDVSRCGSGEVSFVNSRSRRCNGQ